MLFCLILNIKNLPTKEWPWNDEGDWDSGATRMSGTELIILTGVVRQVYKGTVLASIIKNVATI